MAVLTERAQAFRSAITAFIEERRDAKLKGNDNDEVAEKYEYAVWLADATKRVKWIQAVTHVLKATHQDAQGSSLYVDPSSLPQHNEVGSHLLGEDFREDITGNAGGMGVSKFLFETKVEDRRLIDWVLDNDADLITALSSDTDQAKQWMEDFASVIEKGSTAESHPFAKQLYWLVEEEPSDDNGYHLLEPLYASSLAHEVYTEIERARFGEANLAAKKQFFSRVQSSEVFLDYKNLVEQKLGSSKPQMISLLNNERRGKNYLLGSLPPKWTSKNQIKLLHVDSALTAFRWFEDVPDLLKKLSAFLRSDPEKIKETRETREALEQALGQQLALFGESIRLSQEPGWTRNASCQLPLCEKLWLDPERTELPVRETHEQEDADFNAAYTWGDWPDEVASRFASWLNAYLRDKKITSVGDAEHKHWAKQAFIEEINWPVPLRRRATGGGA